MAVVAGCCVVNTDARAAAAAGFTAAALAAADADATAADAAAVAAMASIAGRKAAAVVTALAASTHETCPFKYVSLHKKIFYRLDLTKWRMREWSIH